MDNTFSTSDVALTTFLKLRGYALIGVEKSRDDGKVKFLFNNGSDLQQDQLSYYNNSDASKVVAKQFYEELNGVKTILFNTL